MMGFVEVEIATSAIFQAVFPVAVVYLTLFAWNKKKTRKRIA